MNDCTKWQRTRTADLPILLLDESEVLNGPFPAGRTTLWKKIRAGEAPPPVEISPGRKAWRPQDWIDWIESLPVYPPYVGVVQKWRERLLKDPPPPA